MPYSKSFLRQGSVVILYPTSPYSYVGPETPNLGPHFESM